MSPPFIQSGYLSFDNKLDHAVNILFALRNRPVSRIFILVKFSSRIDNMIRDVKDIVSPLFEYHNLLTVLVTAWDTYDRTQETADEIRNRFSQFNIKSIFFVGLETSGEAMKSSLEAMCTNPVRIDVPDNKIHKYFDIKKEDWAIIKHISENTHEVTNIKNWFNTHK